MIPQLSLNSSNAALQKRLRELGWASYGSKFELWNRSCRAEAHAVQQAKDIEVMESRQRALERGTPVAATTLPVPPVARSDYH